MQGVVYKVREKLSDEIFALKCIKSSDREIILNV